jgi:indole-3-glycerol phosphate synthase
MSVLDKILEQKKIEIALLDMQGLRYAAESSPAPRDFLCAVRGDGERVKFIAELKRASPSKGILAPNLDLYQVAEIYSHNGASAISVLTDEKFFLGSLETLRQLRFEKHAELPLLRKDFIIHPSQVYQSRANGADSILLIAAALSDDALLADLHALALTLGLTPLVEVHDEDETERALKIPDIRLIGINNRNLATFDVTLETAERLRPLIPGTIPVVAESGIFNADDVQRLAKANVSAILVGEALVTSQDIAAKVRELLGLNVQTFER